MNLRCICVLSLVGSLGAAAAPGRSAPADALGSDNALAAARKFVEQSDRYLHHSRLRRGMKGHGLTVLAGADIQRFGVEIVSVVPSWEPHRSAILARLSGLGLEKTGVIQGMSGSPVFIRDPRDGREKIVGAVAFGWQGQKEPLVGLQPITNMLAIAGVLPGKARPEPATKPAATRPATHPAASRSGATGSAPEAFLRAALNPNKLDFACFTWPPEGPRDTPDAPGSGLTPLATPLIVSGAHRRTVAYLGRHLRPMGVVPLRGGGGGGVADEQLAQRLRLEPGSALTVPLVRGDVDWAAAGTVTDVVGQRVIAFGHAFFGEGNSAMPIGTSYVHTVISNLFASFRLDSPLRQQGATERDEAVGISGVLGKKAELIPVTITVGWPGDRRDQVFRYEVVRHRRFTGLLVGALVQNSAWSWRDLPQYHTVRYALAVDFGKLGNFRSSNLSSGENVMWPVSDAVRAITVLMNSPLGKPPRVESVEVRMSIEPRQTIAQILDLKLAGRIYRPGETLTGTVTYRRFRRPRQSLPVHFRLPADLPEGQYTLTACDAAVALGSQAREAPHRFHPETVEQLFEALGRVVEPQSTDLYLRLALRDAGLALGQRELPQLPDSRARILTEANLIDTRAFAHTLERTVRTLFVLRGTTEARFVVQERPGQRRLQK